MYPFRPARYHRASMFSKFLRQSHMYLALFLTPWMLVYALSTMAMNHRQFFTKRGDNPIRFEK